MSGDVGVDVAWPDPGNWPTTAEFVAMVKEVPYGFPLCRGCEEASNPDDRSERLPHHFDCPAVEGWAAVRSWHAECVEAARKSRDYVFGVCRCGLGVLRHINGEDYWHIDIDGSRSHDHSVALDPEVVKIGG